MSSEFYSDPLEGIRALSERVEQANDIKNFVMSWYGVQSFEDLPPEGKRWVEEQMLASGWERMEESND